MTDGMIHDLRLAKDGDNEAASRLIEENSGLIWSIARRFFGRGCEPDDLYQLGCVGFLKAISGYDESFGTQFSTYAVPKISGEIRRFLRDDGAIKVSRGIKEQSAHIKAARLSLEQKLGREPHISEISEETGLSSEEIAFAETAAAPAESLQREAGEDGFTLEHVLSDSFGEEKMLEKVSLKLAIEKLPDKEKKTIFLRYYHGMTQENAAKILGISQVQVSRIEKKAIERLREILE